MNDAFFALAIIAWFAYLASRLFRRQVPELVAFLLVGAVLGPSVLNLLDEESLRRLEPVVEGALAVLMFVIGERISVRALRAARWILTGGVIQYVVTGVALYFVALQLGAERPTALMLATIAGAGAPMTVSSVVTSARARGRYPEGLIGTHALSDGLAATVFAASLPVAEFMVGTGTDAGTAVTRFVKLGIGGLVLGLVLGWVIARLGQQIETSGELLLFVLVHLLIAQSAATALDLSLPLAAIVMGATTGSLSPSDHSQRVFVVVRMIEQPLYLLFFALAGASIHLEEIPGIGALGAAYVAVRAGGKIVGGFAGGWIGGLPWRRAGRLGVDLMPQAGVAVGLAVIAAETLPDVGSRVATVVLGSVVLFELAGSLLVSRGLRALAAARPGTDEEQPSSDQVPKKVLIASRSQVTAPAWLLDAASRWGADVVVLARGKEDDPQAKRLRDRAGQRSLAFRWIPLKAESFTGAVTRTAESTGADLVVVLTPEARLGFESRLVLLPHERIARQLSVPVLFLPLPSAPTERLSKPAETRAREPEGVRPGESPARRGVAPAPGPTGASGEGSPETAATSESRGVRGSSRPRR